MKKHTLPEKTFAWVCHTTHRIWKGGDYNGHWEQVGVGHTIYGDKEWMAPEQEENYDKYTYRLEE